MLNGRNWAEKNNFALIALSAVQMGTFVHRQAPGVSAFEWIILSLIATIRPILMIWRVPTQFTNPHGRWHTGSRTASPAMAISAWRWAVPWR